MSRDQSKGTVALTSLYEQFLKNRSEEECVSEHDWVRSDQQELTRLKKRGVQTVDELVEHLPHLPPKLKHFGFRLISLLNLYEAVEVLLELTVDPEYRLAAAHALSWISRPKRSSKRIKRFFLKRAQRELEATEPDINWLHAAVIGLGVGFCDDREAIELLVSIYERGDLPGWLRGEAANELGTCHYLSDRRTTLFRRCRKTAIKGLYDESIEMQFWSVYLICSMASNRRPPFQLNQDPFYPALKKLRQIAKQDQRLAPGYWWPISAEAEDAIGCIQTGRWPQPDAGERWIENAHKNRRGERDVC